MASRAISVLVVEDEPLIRINIVTELEDEGFTVLEAGDAREATALLEAHAVVNVIFTDMDIPGGINGLELARLFRERVPAMHVIVTSGFHYIYEEDLPPLASFSPSHTWRRVWLRPYYL
jgi:CheY-like chemotaxis protein